jgi:hypothetical protein
MLYHLLNGCCVTVFSFVFFFLLKIVKNWETSKPWLPKKRIDEVIIELSEISE